VADVVAHSLGHQESASFWTVVETVIDNDMSASTGKPRPGYQRLLSLMRSGSVDAIVVWHVDRLTRRLVDLEEVITICEATGTRLATVTGDLDLSTDTGRMMARILASVARGEVERKGIRQRRANEQRATAGCMGWTRRPFGYNQKDGAIVVVDAEAKALERAADMVLTGETLAAGVRMLDAEGLTTTAGKPWNVTSLRRALLNPRYAGRVSYNGADVTEGKWPIVLPGWLISEPKGRDPPEGFTDLVDLGAGISPTGLTGRMTGTSPAGSRRQAR
jgi:DNA invertase Pin-like site-specific DNA recombinase